MSQCAREPEGARWRRLRPGGHVLTAGHRGASREAPENTLAAFRLALDLGVSAVECDVHRTRDGRLVVIHDPTVDRTTDGHGVIDALTLDDLRRLDAGRWFGPAFAGERIPTLDAVLELVRGRARVLLEIKNGPIFYEGIEAQVVEALRRHGMEEAALVMSFDHAAVRGVRALAPHIATGVIYSGRLIDAPAAARAAAADALCPGWTLVTPETVADAHRAGLGVFVWTVDDPDAMRRVLAWGVDGVTSNDARLLMRVTRSA